MVSIDAVRARIEAAIHCEVLEVVDTSAGCGASFSVLAVSQEFEGVPLLQRHRMINELFTAELQSQIHALTLKTLTRAQHIAKR